MSFGDDTLNPDMTLEGWVQYGIDQGYAVRNYHYGWDGITKVPTLIIETEEVKDLRRRGRGGPLTDCGETGAMSA